MTSPTLSPDRDQAVTELPGRTEWQEGHRPDVIRSDLVVRGRIRMIFWLLAVLWIAASAFFWYVWFQSNSSLTTLWLFIPLSFALAYDGTVLPSIYLYYVGRMRRPRPIAAPPGLRVALITLCVPSAESIDVIVGQLTMLTRVRYPHDSWILDEGNDPLVRREAERLGVRYFSRAGIDRYNQTTAPFQAKTKAGNVNAWIDSHGSSYDFFVQFDIDHRPEPHYLDRVLGYFLDPTVGWVQAPSLYGNLENWVARGAAEQELVLQGPLQEGFYGSNRTPFIIGSHCTYRTAAIREIGGFQPTRAEDHLDSLALAARGYRGVFVPEVLALGNGPDTFDIYLHQQFAWAYSMMQIFFTRAPRLLWHCRPRQALQFLFAESWYTLWGTSMLVLFGVPMVALLTQARPSAIGFSTFVLASLPLSATRLIIWQWTRRWQFPIGLGLSWRGIILHVARWPVVVWALINVVLGIKHPYMITPKGKSNGLPLLSLASQGLYLILAMVNLGAVWLHVFLGLPLNNGYILYALLGASWMLLVVATNVVGDVVLLAHRRVSALRIVRLRFVPVAISCLVAFGIAYATSSQADQILTASGWSDEASGAVVNSFDRPTATPGEPMRSIASVAPGVNTVEPTVLRGVTPTASTIALPSRSLTIASTPHADSSTETAQRASPAALSPGRIVVGAYDPQHALTAASLGLEHVFLNDDDSGRLSEALAAARGQRVLLATIELARLPGADRATLEALVAGRYDANLKSLANIVRDQETQIVLVRWGQEMDLAGLYPWSVGDPALYRAAYRHVVSVFRDVGAANARWVWSPAGTERALAFYPGGDVVDYVGLTVLGDATWDSLYGLPPQSFVQILRPRYELVQPLLKPIILAEVGVSGSPERQSAWLADAAASLGEFPSIQAIVYFNAVNAANNHRSTEPDWGLRPNDFNRFVQEVAQRRASPMIP